MITVEYLKQKLHYDPLTGIFTHIQNRTRPLLIGTTAGTVDKGYVVIKLGGRSYMAHRLAWMYVTGKAPKKQIGHENGIRHDNRFSNLKELGGPERTKDNLWDIWTMALF